jgi:hypothetical protein
MSTPPLLCSRCQSAPRLLRQRWCRQCLTSAQRQRRRAARHAAQAEDATASVTHTALQALAPLTQTPAPVRPEAEQGLIEALQGPLPPRGSAAGRALCGRYTGPVAGPPGVSHRSAGVRGSAPDRPWVDAHGPQHRAGALVAEGRGCETAVLRLRPRSRTRPALNSIEGRKHATPLHGVSERLVYMLTLHNDTSPEAEHTRRVTSRGSPEAAWLKWAP